MYSTPAYKDLVLVGGGHSHALFIRKWAMQPLPGVRLTLVSESALTPYSGMLPGLLAGYYSHEQAHIDLARLCQWAGVRFIAHRMHGIDLQTKRIQMQGRPDLEYDLLSLDTGSTPDLSVPGASEHAIPVKPVSTLFERWQQLHGQLKQQGQPINLGVVGSGAGGFEILMGLRHALPADVTLHWILRGQTPLNGRPTKVGALALQAAVDAGVVIHKGFDVASISDGVVRSANNIDIALDDVLWCTAAAAPGWAAASGLQVDGRGFVATNAHLQSVSHPDVFATGDIGTQINTPSDKAGVYAVRQAPVLFANVQRYFLEKPLKSYKPQKTFLSLMAVNHQSAIGNRGSLTFQGRLLWKLKNHIDQKFMQQFRKLPKMQSRQHLFKVPAQISGSSGKDELMRCKGCGSKVAESTLHTVLSQLQPTSRDDIESGLDQLDDAAVFSADNTRWVQSVDQLSAITDDLYQFGKIAAVHAISDVVTQTTDVHSAQAVLTLPHAGVEVTRRDLSQLLSGALESLNDEGCALVGGHTAEAAELLLGFVVNGKLSDSNQVATGTDLSEGDAVVLCKAMGTGVIMAAHAQLLASGVDVFHALKQMQQSNRDAALILKQAAARRVTDVTGFGLLAHLHSLLGDNRLRVAIDIDHLPLLSGALALAKLGVQSSLYESNSHTLRLFDGADALPKELKTLLCDPQTSGGLLAVVPKENTEFALDQLRDAGFGYASIIGRIVKAPASIINVGNAT